MHFGGGDAWLLLMFADDWLGPDGFIASRPSRLVFLCATLQLMCSRSASSTCCFYKLSSSRLFTPSAKCRKAQASTDYV